MGRELGRECQGIPAAIPFSLLGRFCSAVRRQAGEFSLQGIVSPSRTLLTTLPNLMANRLGLPLTSKSLASIIADKPIGLAQSGKTNIADLTASVEIWRNRIGCSKKFTNASAARWHSEMDYILLIRNLQGMTIITTSLREAFQRS